MNDTPHRSPAHPSPAPIASLAGGLAACCTIHVLVLAGVLAGLSGYALGGIALGTGITVAALIWVGVTLLRHRHRPGCTPRTGPGSTETDDRRVSERHA